jgi:hypothetical protein
MAHDPGELVARLRTAGEDMADVEVKSVGTVNRMSSSSQASGPCLTIR